MTYYQEDDSPLKRSEYRTGLNSGQKQRSKDKSTGIYPRDNMPVNQKKSEIWTTAYQNAYYRPNLTGKPLEGNSPKATITVRVDSDILDRAKDLNINVSKACQNGIKDAIEIKNISLSHDSL